MDKPGSFIYRLREDFSKHSLSENDVAADPSAQFSKWLAEAIEARVPEVQAMTLATVSPAHKPSVRTVYLREYENDQYWFYTNYDSGKARDLSQNPNVSVLFYWKELERQIRIDGQVEKAAAVKSDSYFDHRPYNSKIGAWASSQSRPLQSRAVLEQRINEMKQTFSEENIRRPPNWGGYVLRAGFYEFWQGRPSRLHDRIVYEKKGNHWQISRLYP